MNKHRTLGLVAVVTVSLAAVALGAVPGASAAVRTRVSTPHSAPAGRQLAVLKGSGLAYNDRFGSEVAISGTTAVVSEGTSPGLGAGGGLATTSVWVFSKTKSGWKQTAKLTGSGAKADTTDDEFGYSLAISGDTIVVGAPFYGGVFGAGRAYVFTETTSGWRQTAVLAESDPAAENQDQFGSAVAISGGTIVVSAPNHPHGTVFGEAYVFARNGAGWKQAAELPGTNQFGHSVAVLGATIVVGSPYDALGAGRAYVYAKTAGGWKRTATLKGSDTTSVGRNLESGDHFGWSVAISGANIAVGAPLHAGYSGRVYVLTRNKAGWKQTAELKYVQASEFGGQVGISGSTLIADDEQIASPALVFAHSRTGWKRITVLRPANGGYGGEPVAISGPTALVGAPTGGNYSGRAYLYQA